MIDCKECGVKNLENAKFCKECGKALTIDFEDRDKIICMNCDHINPLDTKFCEQCGEKIILNKEIKLKSQLISVMLRYHEYTQESMEILNKGMDSGMIKSEAKEIFLESKEIIKKVINFLEKCLKKTNDKELLELIKKQIKFAKNELKAAEELIEKNEDNSFVCPYCKREIDVEGGIQDKEMKIQCELCHKEFKCITGEIKTIRGKTNSKVQYGPEPISITLKQNKKEKIINFKTTFRFLVNKGDRVSFIYLKKSFLNSYKENPSIIFNLSTEEVYKVGVSFF